MLWLLWITQYYYLITDALQDTMEEWMKLLACSSHDYMKLMVYELQQKLAELDAIDVTSSRSCDFRENVSRYIHILKFWNCKTMIRFAHSASLLSFIYTVGTEFTPIKNVKRQIPIPKQSFRILHHIPIIWRNVRIMLKVMGKYPIVSIRENYI